MKKILATLTLTGIVLGAWTGFASTASAATITNGTATSDTPAQGNSTAEFTIDAGKLSLDKVSDLKFSKNGTNPTIEDFTDDQKLTLDGTKITDNQASVSDYRGSHDGWKLAVNMTPFSNGKDTISGNTLTLTAKSDSSNGVAVETTPPVTTDITDNGKDNIFITAAPDKGTFSNIFALGGELNVPANPSIQAGTYTSTLTWTLSATAQAQPAAE
ncbi:WxL domain-containing protein [Enterococcus sp. 669A]|uniref:WxL domain-containing protein n=1 Tax=Candidatus Enterococcus moelleringii TaxID=2815325 RepID=A0ABS3L5K8_9ENTE|nr:WxL domain-containing protein [Enterococcus sp. 669A]MBO1304897.1 WxL domain-containing protein [Enterococcus sp. 669A]